MAIHFDTLAQQALDLMHETSDSLFLTGKAGTGKSTLIQYFLETTTRNVLVLAPTGVAAVNVGGVTIHSFFGMHPGITLDEARDGEYHLHRKNRDILEHVDTIVIDEISMVRADVLEVVNEILQQFYVTREPFGGKQLLLVGDVYQLPPVVRGDEYAFFNEVYGSPYFFSAPSYQALAPRTIELQHIYRQEDEAFKTVLNKIRLGLQTPEDLQLINQRCQHKPRGKTHAITLVTTNADADKINQQQLARLKTPLYQSQALIQGEVPASMYMNDPSANFKPGAQVMMLVNGPGYNNGSLGTIVSYDPVEEYAIVEINGEEYDIRQHKREIRKPSYDKAEKTIVNEVVGTFSQLPFKLARAITIHKSQGKTFEQVVVDFGKRVFSKGQAYVALSRVTALEGLYLLRAVTMDDIQVDGRVRNFMSAQMRKQRQELLTQAIAAGQQVAFTYVHTDGVTTRRVVTPQSVSEMEYQGYSYLGLQAQCHLRERPRVFSLSRMFELEVVESK